MLHARIARFDVMATVALFGNLGWELNTRLHIYKTTSLADRLRRLPVWAKHPHVLSCRPGGPSR